MPPQTATLDRYIQKKLSRHGHSPDGQDLAHEGVRLLTYDKWPMESKVFPTSLAKTGLYFTGHGDSTKCYACNTEFNNWNKGDNPSEIHKSRSPRCPVVLGTSSEEKEWAGSERTLDKVREMQEKFSRLRSNFSAPRPNANQGGGDRQANRSYRFESERLKTFDQWTSPFVQPRDLARSGFFYLGDLDRVQCYFCRGILRNWESGDNVATEHRKHFTDCPFVNDRDVGNIPIETCDNVNSLPFPDAKNREFSTFDSRLATFANFPESTTGQSSRNIASAGFFYTGEADNVKCFYCDGGLKGWERTDVAWEEHARWFPRCRFLIQEKGQEFAGRFSTLGPMSSAPVPRTPSIPSGPAQAASTNTTPRSRPAPPTTGIEYRVDPREIKARLDIPMVKSVLQLGYTKEQVSRCLEQRLKTHGDDFPSAESLLEAILDDEVRRENSPNNPPANGAGDEGVAMAAAVAEPQPIPPELQEEAQSIIEENQSMKEQRTCKVCMDAEVNVVFLPCGHLVCCQDCAPQVTKCPICRAFIRGTVKIYQV